MVHGTVHTGRLWIRGTPNTQKKVISKREDYSQTDDEFSSQKWSPKYYSRLWDYLEGQIEKILSKGELPSQNENMRLFYVSSLEELSFCKRQYTLTMRRMPSNHKRKFWEEFWWRIFLFFWDYFFLGEERVCRGACRLWKKSRVRREVGHYASYLEY